MGPLELLDGEGPQLPRTRWLSSEPAARNETAATSLVCPPLPLPTGPPEGAVGDGDPVGVGLDVGVVGVGVGDVMVGDGLGDVVDVGADEHEADGAACLALAAGLVADGCAE